MGKIGVSGLYRRTPPQGSGHPKLDLADCGEKRISRSGYPETPEAEPPERVRVVGKTELSMPMVPRHRCADSRTPGRFVLPLLAVALALKVWASGLGLGR